MQVIEGIPLAFNDLSIYALLRLNIFFLFFCNKQERGLLGQTLNKGGLLTGKYAEC